MFFAPHLAQRSAFIRTLSNGCRAGKLVFVAEFRVETCAEKGYKIMYFFVLNALIIFPELKITRV